MKRFSHFTRKKVLHSIIAALMITTMLFCTLIKTENVHAFSQKNMGIDGKWTNTAEITDTDRNQYYKITLPGDGKLTVTLQCWFSIVSLSLWDEDLTTKYVDNKSLTKGKASQPSSGALVDMYLKAGTYYVEVSYNDNYTGYSEIRTGEYRLKAAFVNGNTNETEPNDKAQNAIDLNKTSTVTGMMWQADEYDYYKVATDGSGPIKIRLSSWMGYIGYGIRDADQMPVYDKEGKELTDQALNKGSESEPAVEILEFPVPKGDYYFFLKKYDGYTGYSYTNTGIYKLELDPDKAAGEEKKETVIEKGTKTFYKDQGYQVLDDAAVAFVKANNKKNVTVPATITINGNTYRVTQINAKAFKGSKIRKVTIGKNVRVIKAKAFSGSKAGKIILKTKLLKKKTVKNCLKGSKVNTVQVKAGSAGENKKIRKAYKKIFTKKNAGRKVSVK